MYEAPLQPWIRFIAMADMWTDICQQDVLNRGATRAGISLATLGLSLSGGQLILYHCFAVLFVTMGISDITSVDISSPANNTSVYLCL